MSEERHPLPRPRCRRLMGVRLLGSGSYVPDGVVTNDHLYQKFGFDSDWIVKRTGILERRHALPHQATSDLCHGASDLALVVGGDCNSRILNPTDIKTYPLFGDGAGAVLIGKGRPDQGLVAYSMGADGSGGDLLSRPAGGSRMKLCPEVLAKGLH